MMSPLNNLKFSEDFKLKTMVMVEELTNYDMIYIYHHIHKDVIVELEYCEETLAKDLKYWVRYKGFTLGKVTITGVLRTLYEGIHSLQAHVGDFSKQKYLPFNGLDIIIQATKMRQVS